MISYLILSRRAGLHDIRGQRRTAPAAHGHAAHRDILESIRAIFSTFPSLLGRTTTKNGDHYARRNQCRHACDHEQKTEGIETA